MRLFLSSSVKVYYIYFKGSGQHRTSGQTPPPRIGAENRRCRLGERVGEVAHATRGRHLDAWACED